MNAYRFYKGVADHGDRDSFGGIEASWILRCIENEDHPEYGPPLPMSMRSPMEQILHNIYAPMLRELIERPMWGEWHEPTDAS